MLKSDIGTWTFNLINIGSCNSKSSIILVKDINELLSWPENQGILFFLYF